MIRTPLLRPKAFFERGAPDLDGVRGTALAVGLSLAFLANRSARRHARRRVPSL